MLLLLAVAAGIPTPAAYAKAGDWPTYLQSNARRGFNAAETIINPSSAPHLKVHWKFLAGGAIFSQPIEANGYIYWGSFDGYEHESNLDGSQVWQQFLGQKPSNCGKNVFGVVSTATVASVSINGTLTTVVLVGGGDGDFYALNADTGGVIWKTVLGSAANRFIWDSPAFYNGSVYIGIASIGDCPLVQGKLFQLNASTGVIQHTFNIVPNRCTGAGLWGSTTINQTDGTIFLVTGNPGSCSTAEPYAVALVKLRASDLSFMSSWQVPTSEQTSDSDFGATPTLFPATINGVVHSIVGVANKNGIYYALDQHAISSGPVWKVRIAIVNGKGPEQGSGSISPSAWDGTTLYVAGGNTTINGTSCQGSLRALNPATGAFLWQHCMADGPVVGAVTVVPGVAAVGEGTALILIATASGKTLFTFQDAHSNSFFFGPASISNGVLYIGNQDGYLYAFEP